MLKRAAFAFLTLLAACTPSLATFNRLAPHDGGVFKAAGDATYGAGPRHKLDVYAPRGAERAPVIVFFYGGSWKTGDRRDYSFVGDAFGAQGFVTIIPDYRLYPEVRYPDFLDDCADAVRWAQDHAARYGGDPNRIVLVGHSAGGYNAAMLGLDARYLRAAGVDARNIRGVAGLAGPYDFYPFDVSASRDTFGQAPDPQATQPVTYARANAPPFFMAWGERDDLVGRQNIVGLTRALVAAGAAPEVKLYPRLDHVGMLLALSRPLRGRAPVLRDVTAFAKRVTAQP